MWRKGLFNWNKMGEKMRGSELRYKRLSQPPKKGRCIILRWKTIQQNV